MEEEKKILTIKIDEDSLMGIAMLTSMGLDLSSHIELDPNELKFLQVSVENFAIALKGVSNKFSVEILEQRNNLA